MFFLFWLSGMWVFWVGLFVDLGLLTLTKDYLGLLSLRSEKKLARVKLLLNLTVTKAVDIQLQS